MDQYFEMGMHLDYWMLMELMFQLTGHCLVDLMVLQKADLN